MALQTEKLIFELALIFIADTETDSRYCTTKFVNILVIRGVPKSEYFGSQKKGG